jgi:hypothetical protein
LYLVVYSIEALAGTNHRPVWPFLLSFLQCWV